MDLPLSQRRGLERAQGAGKVALQPPGVLVETVARASADKNGQRCLEEALPSPLDVVAEPAQVLQRQLLLGRSLPPFFQRQGTGRFHLDAFPLQPPGGRCSVLGGDVEREVKGYAVGQQAREPAGEEVSGPPVQHQAAYRAAIEHQGPGANLQRRCRRRCVR